MPSATIAAEMTGLLPWTALSDPPMISPNIAAHITAPTTSNGSSRLSGLGSAKPSASETSAKGIALANTQGQGAMARTSPPNVGAAAAELVTTTELIPSPRPSWFAG